MSNFIEEQNKERTDFSDENVLHRRVTLETIFCSKLSKGLIFLLIFATVCPLLMYYFVINKTEPKQTDTYSCLVERSYRVPCGPVNVSSGLCLAKQCCYDSTYSTCFHYMPSKYYYESEESSGQYSAVLSSSPYGTKSVQTLEITVSELNENQLSIILHESAIKENGTTVKEKNYKIELVESKLMVQVSRNKGDDILLTTSKGPLIASEKYWEWSLYLTNQSLFGLGETLISLGENSTLTKVIYKNQYDHSTSPNFWAYLNGKFHGVVVKHDGAMEIEVLPSNLVILRSLTGERIELVVSLGPTPTDLHSQQMGVLKLPPYWALGTHICRKSTNTDLDSILKEFSENNGNTGMDTDCIHENLLMAIAKNTDETTMDLLKQYLNELLTSGKKLLVSVPPHVLANSTTNSLYALAEKLDILYKNNSKIYTGKYLGQNVAFPDFTHSSSQRYITELGQFLDAQFGVENISGIILNENWPLNENYQIKGNESFPHFPQTLKNALSLTIPWNLNMTNNSTETHIKYHNSYGSTQYSLISNYYQNISGEKFIMSATKRFGENQPTIVENESTSWERLNASLRKVLFESISGNHLVSVPVCGDTATYDKSLQEVLCMRWYLVAATMPIFRISSYQSYRDPNSLDSGFATNSANLAIARRKLLQAYYYTVLSRGEPLVRPLFYDFYEDEATFFVDGQYMVGKNMLVAHPLSLGRTKLNIYLPNKISVWYEFFGGDMYKPNSDNSTIVLDILETDWITFIPQGSIVPLMDDSTLNLVVGLNCENITSCNATGELFLNNSYIQIAASEQSIILSNLSENNCNITLGYLKVYYYDNSTGFKEYYSKNLQLCDKSSGNSTLIWYVEPLTTTISPPELSSTHSTDTITTTISPPELSSTHSTDTITTTIRTTDLTSTDSTDTTGTTDGKYSILQNFTVKSNN